ncbi:WD40 repeat domain-containing protein [Aureivirga marina]|uniref:hypothetical protein n=1 Tax=Aureivirga marina TaxID=1182451 RepID=UPI0018CAB8BF|nr:hypothetical protein [Aureivirga marina]
MIKIDTLKEVNCSIEEGGIVINDSLNATNLNFDADSIAIYDENLATFWSLDLEQCKLYRLKKDLIKRKDIKKIIISKSLNHIYIRCFAKKTIDVFDLTNLKKIASFKHNDWVKDMDFCESTKILVSSDGKGFWYQWNLEELDLEKKGKAKKSKKVFARIKIAQNGKFILTNSYNYSVNQFIIWDLETGNPIYESDESNNADNQFKVNTYTGEFEIGGFIDDETVLLYSNYNIKSYIPANEKKYFELFEYNFKTNQLKKSEFDGTIADISSSCQHLVIKNPMNPPTILTTENKTITTIPFKWDLKNAVFSTDDMQVILTPNVGTSFIYTIDN